MTENPELERRVDRALKQLPPPAAPPAFASRVMRAIEAHAMPDAARAASVSSKEWPVALKIALSGMSFVLIVGALLMWPLALEFAHTSWQSPEVVLLRVAASSVRPMIPAVLVYVTAMCAVCAAAASMLKHVALGGVSQS